MPPRHRNCGLQKMIGKNKSDGVYPTKLAASGFEEREGIHYGSKNIATPGLNHSISKIPSAMMTVKAQNYAP
jgi:hypothetical protein